MNISNFTGIVSPSLKDFYSRFSSEISNPTKGHGAYKLAKNYLFNVNILWQPWNSAIWPILGINTLDPTGQSFRLMVQSIELPNLILHDLDVEGSQETTSDGSDNFMKTEFGYGVVGNTVVLPEKNTFSMKILNTEFSLHEHAFYYWLNEVDSQQWLYADYPFTKATFFISAINQQTMLPNCIYILSNVFPSKIELMSFDHDNKNELTRKIEFNFSRLLILPNVQDLLLTVADLAQTKF